MQDFPADRKKSKYKKSTKKPKIITKLVTPTDPDPDPAISTYSDIPKDLDIFFRTIQDFIPAGKTWDDLTSEEQEIIKNQYRFDPLFPGLYQSITGFQGMI